MSKQFISGLRFILRTIAICMLLSVCWSEPKANSKTENKSKQTRLMQRSVCETETLREKDVLVEEGSLEPKNIDVQTKDPVLLKYKIHSVIWHNTEVMTEGLAIDNTLIYESGGGLGVSNIGKYNIADPKAYENKLLPGVYFAEGLFVKGQRIFQFVLKKNKIFVFDTSLLLLETKNFDFDVWGAVLWNNRIVTSDGSDNLRITNYSNGVSERNVKVYFQQYRVQGLNELEVVGDYLLANILPSECIGIISLRNGELLAAIDVSELRRVNSDDESSTNGIAFEPKSNRIYLTGKFWPKMYAIELDEDVIAAILTGQLEKMLKNSHIH